MKIPKTIISIFLALLIVVMVFCAPILKADLLIEASAAGPVTFSIVSYIILSLLMSVGVSLAASPELNMQVAEGIYDDMQQAQKNVIDGMASAYEATINDPGFMQNWEDALSSGGVVAMDWTVTDYKSALNAILNIISNNNNYSVLVSETDIFHPISSGYGYGTYLNSNFTTFNSLYGLLQYDAAFTVYNNGEPFTFYYRADNYDHVKQYKLEGGIIYNRYILDYAYKNLTINQLNALISDRPWYFDTYSDYDAMSLYFYGTTHVDGLAIFSFDVVGDTLVSNRLVSSGIPNLVDLYYEQTLNIPCDVPIVKDRDLTSDMVIDWLRVAEMEGTLAADDVLSLPLTLDPTVASVDSWPVDLSGNLVSTVAPVLEYGADLSVPIDIVDSFPADMPINDLKINANIITKFPFCIPFDIYNIFALVNTTARSPVFIIPFEVGEWIDYDIELDLTVFDDVIAIIRWFELVIFGAGLAFATRSLIKW